MRKRFLAVVILVAVLSATAGAVAAPRWRVFARGQDTDDFYVYASVNADAPKSRALAVRAVSSTTKTITLSYMVMCEGARRVRSGTVLVVAVSTATKCSLSSDATVDGGGSVRVELLRR